MKRLSLVVLVLAAGALAAAASADTVIDFEVTFAEKRGEPGPTIEHHTYSLDETRGRVEQGDEAYIVDTEKGTLYYLDLDDRHVQRYPSPLHKEDTFPPEIRAEARRRIAEQTPKRIEVTELEGTEEMDGYAVRHVVMEAGGPGEPMTARIDLWVSSELWGRLEGSAYWDLERDRLATSPFTAWIADALRELRAFPVRTEMVIPSLPTSSETMSPRILLSTRARSESSYVEEEGRRVGRARRSAPAAGGSRRRPEAAGARGLGAGPGAGGACSSAHVHGRVQAVNRARGGRVHEAG